MQESMCESMSLPTRMIWGHIIITHPHDITVNERESVTVKASESEYVSTD